LEPTVFLKAHCRRELLLDTTVPEARLHERCASVPHTYKLGRLRVGLTNRLDSLRNTQTSIRFLRDNLVEIKLRRHERVLRGNASEVRVFTLTKIIASGRLRLQAQIICLSAGSSFTPKTTNPTFSGGWNQPSS